MSLIDVAREMDSRLASLCHTANRIARNSGCMTPLTGDELKKSPDSLASIMDDCMSSLSALEGTLNAIEGIVGDPACISHDADRQPSHVPLARVMGRARTVGN